MPDADLTIDADYTRRCPVRVWWVLLAAVLVGAVLVPLDGPIATICRRVQPGGDLALGGDLRRTLEWLQQFGDAATCTIILLAAWMLDRKVGRRCLDAVVALVATSLATHAIKMLVGRPRPRVMFDPATPREWASAWVFPGPWRAVPLAREGLDGPVYGWQIWKGLGSDLASMPSSHTSGAAALAVCLCVMFPRLAPLAWSLVAVVGVSRVLLGAHYPSDVIVGAGLGYVVATLVMRAGWFSRPR